MDISVDQYKSDASNRSDPFSAVLQTIRNAVRWMIRLVVLTEEDRTKAGIYLGGEGRDSDR